MRVFAWLGRAAVPLLVSLALPALAAAAIGELVVLRGEVLIVRGPTTIRVADRVALEEGDRLETLDATKVHVRLYGEEADSEAILTRNTRVTVHELRGRGTGSPFRLLFGAFRARVAAFFGSRPLVATPTATVGIKGTDFIVYVKRAEATEFIGVEGLIEATSRSRPEYTLRIGRRQWGEIVADQRPLPPVRVPDELWESALEEFSFPQ